MVFHVSLLLLALSLAQAPAVAPSQAPSKEAEVKSEPKIDPEIAEKLLKVKRIYVDSFGEDNVAKQLHAMVINALSESKRFIVTENREKADAILRGSALEKTSQELHAFGEAASSAAAAGAHSGESRGSVYGTVSDGRGTLVGSQSGSERGGFAATAMSAADSAASTETINDARLAVRLVAADGDVIWTSTQESKGAKYKGASADVADKIVKQLLRDLGKLQAGKQ